MSWDLKSDECQNTIEASYLAAQSLLNDVDLRIYVHDNYGKGEIYNLQSIKDTFH